MISNATVTFIILFPELSRQMTHMVLLIEF